MDLRYFYVEKFIDYDNTDFRVDIVDGEFVSCYGRKANGTDWRTNVTSGGSVFLCAKQMMRSLMWLNDACKLQRV